jgi:outer membrane protein TolC
MEINEAANTLLDLSEQMSAAKAKFNALLGRPGDSPLTVADTLRQIPLPFDPASAAGTLRAQNPSLRAINEEGASLKAKARADKRGAYPSFGIGLQYMLVNSALSGGMNMHGKDMFMPMLSLTLPLYRNKYKAQQREDALRLEASRQQYADMAEQLAAAISRLRSEAAQAAARIELCRRQTELARSLYRLRVQEFASGSSPLDEALQAARLLLSYQVKTADAVASYNTANANIQKLLSSNEGIDF